MYCILGDCNNLWCHNCYPIKNCNIHGKCIKNGICKEYSPDIIVTGCSGFIGSHLCEHLLKKKIYVVGIDNMNSYYDVKRKEYNLSLLKKYNNFVFYNENIINTNLIRELKPKKIVHLAALAGVRSSIEDPINYIDTNIKGFVNILEQSKDINIENIVYASSSSVYGKNEKIPFSEEDELLNVNSPYASTKLCNEIFARLYFKLYKINSIGLRFFTVYGPRGRPDMAPYKFLKNIHNEKEIIKYGNGTSMRDYTYIDDIIHGILSAINLESELNFCKIYNLGNSFPISLNTFIEKCEKIVGKKAIIKNCDKQLGDVEITYANINKAKKELNYNPKISLEEGLFKTFKYEFLN